MRSPRNLLHVLLAGFAVIAALAINGCSGGDSSLFNLGGPAPPAAPIPKFAYVANGNSNTVSAYTINATSGALTPVAGSPITTGALTRPIGVAVARQQ